MPRTMRVDALYSNVSLFPRTSLVIKMPAISNSSKLNNKQVDIPQKAIDSLSSYILSIFDEGTFLNISANSKDTGCRFGASSIPCAGPRNISGMAIGVSGLLTNNTSPTSFSPTVMKLLYNSNDLGELFNNVANSITNEIRQNADKQPLLSGELGTLKSVLDVRWAWIAFPAFLVISSLLFFVIAMVESHRQVVPLWKSSTLAVLSHGIEEKSRDLFTTIEAASEMEHEAAKLDLRLRRDGSNDGKLLS
jgi:hypothetical protein